MTTTTPTARRTLAQLALAACLAALAALALAGPAQAAFGLQPGSFAAKAQYTTDLDSVGTAPEVTQAAAHPDASVVFELNTATDAAGHVYPDGSLKDVSVALPAGFSGNPEATPKCAHQEFKEGTCSNLAMVGVETLRYSPLREVPMLEAVVPVFNLVPPDGTVARYGFQVANVSVMIDMTVRSDGTYSLVSDLGDLSQALAIFGSTLTLWGVPADHNGAGPYDFVGGVSGTWGASSGAPRIPALSLPSRCGPPLTTSISVDGWQHPGVWSTADYTPANGIDGCDKLSFSPTLELGPDTPRAGEPSGYAVTLSSPQSSAPDAPGTPPVEDVAVTLPQGVTVSAASADGLTGCTDRQAAIGSTAPPACPDASKIGSVSIETPVLPDPMSGSIHLGAPTSHDAQTGDMLRLFLIASGHGVTVKLPGKIVPDPVTGQLHATFAGNPQLPFSKLSLHFQGGPRAPLANPRACGTYTTNASLRSWGGQRASSTSSFAIGAGPDGGACVPLGFHPSFDAGMVNSAAGAFSTFSLSFGRDDAQQDLRDVTVALPPGLTGLLASAVLCPDAGAANGVCGDGSLIGHATVGAGPGSSPLHVPPGAVYVTGPYKGAPFGLAIVVDAAAGPFTGPYSLGRVVVRAAIFVDRRSAALRIVSDPLPTILQGIPLRIRDVNVAIDRSGFMLNPTSCSAKRIGGALGSADGASASVGSRFQVGGCKALRYAPRLTLAVGAKGHTQRDRTTPLTATLKMPRGQANNRAITVSLPKLLNARLRVVNDACTLDQFHAGRCTNRVGTAVAVTPLLRDPLRGPAYFVRNPARRLPDLMIALHGQVDVDLTGKVSIPRDLTLRTSFDTIPDVPISMFRLSLVAGRHGPVGATGSLCSAAARRALATVGMRAQSGRVTRVRQHLRIAGCATGKHPLKQR